MVNGLDGHDPFWGKLRASVRAWAERLIGPRLARREDASDLAQNAMLSMFSEADLLTGLDAEPREKLARRILRRRLSDLIRHHHRNRRDVRLEADLETLGSTPSRVEQLLGECGSNPADRAAEHEDQARLIVALASLPEKEQEAIRRRYFDGQEWQSIADALGVAASSVMRWCERGIRSMQEFYCEDAQP